MSDESPATAPTAAAQNPVVAAAAQALAIKELSEGVAGVKKQLKTLWISFAVLAVVTVLLAVTSFVPGLRFGMMGGGGRGTFQRGQNGAPGTFQGAPDTQYGGPQGQPGTQP